jgi:photosystem II stability/assembly factor-like uncharacterized protein
MSIHSASPFPGNGLQILKGGICLRASKEKTMTLSSTKWTAVGPSPVDTPGVSLGSSAGRIEVAAPDPGNADTMYVGANGGGVWKTGVWSNPTPTWLVLTDDMPSISFSGYHPLVVHPKDHGTVFGLVSGPGAGVLRSTNFGLGWELLGNSLFEGAALSSIAVHPTDVKTLYVAAWTGGSFCTPGVYKTTDGGVSWTNLTNFHDGFVSDVIMAKWDRKTLFAGLIPRNSSDGVSTAAVYRSTDEGANWHALSGLPSNFYERSFIRLESAGENGLAYATLFTLDDNIKKGVVSRHRTSDRGNTWKKLAATPGNPETRSWHVLLGVNPNNGKHVFANDAYSLYESKDSGDTWQRADISDGQGIGDDWVNIAFDLKGNVAVTADRGVYHYSLGTQKWQHRCGNLQVTQLYTITLTPQNTDRCFGVAQDHTGPFKFTGSILWHKMPGGTGETGKILVDPQDMKRLYASNPLAPATGLVNVSADGGTSWKVIRTDSAWTNEDYSFGYSVQKSFVMDPSNAKRLLLGTNKVFECKNATASNPVWTALSGILSPSTKVGDQYITALDVAPSDPRSLYAATADGHVWTAKDNGAQWKQNDDGLLGSGVGKVVGFAIDPKNTRRFFAVTSGWAGKNIWFHDPADGKWKNISGNMPWNLGVASIAVDWRFTPNVIYVGSFRGVYRSIDLGVKWKRFGKDMPNTVVSDLQTLPKNNILAAGTSSRGVFEILLSDPKLAIEKILERVPLATRPKRLPDVEAYLHSGDLTILPGKQRGLAPVDARVRNPVGPHRPK